MDATLDILDVKERTIGDANPPSFPTPPTAGAAGFPKPKKRSRFAAQRQQQQQQGQKPSPAAPSAPGQGTHAAPPTTPATAGLHATSNVTRSVASGSGSTYSSTGGSEEMMRIDAENKARLATMSPGEIAAAQREIFESLNPELLQMLLRRANLDEPQSGPSPFDTPPDSAAKSTPEIKVEDTSRTSPPPPPPLLPLEGPEKPESEAPEKKAVSFDKHLPTELPSGISRDAPTATPSHDHDHDHDHDHMPAAAGPTHFPQAPRVPDLDPADPDFLANMHSKYFPDMPVDPSKLAWMAPVPTPDSIADRDSPYHPGRSSLGVPQIRFDFSGRILLPRAAREVPVTQGLHHHGEAPEAAGYTIPELARLARSSFPSQRCIAFQTLGRMLYRLGRGEWGVGLGLDDQDLAQPLWQCFRETKVLETLVDAAGVPDGAGHRSCKVYATEALWLYEQGGWREKLRA